MLPLPCSTVHITPSTTAATAVTISNNNNHVQRMQHSKDGAVNRKLIFHVKQSRSTTNTVHMNQLPIATDHTTNTTTNNNNRCNKSPPPPPSSRMVDTSVYNYSTALTNQSLSQVMNIYNTKSSYWK